MASFGAAFAFPLGDDDVVDVGTFDYAETSVEGAMPVELYTFELPSGTYTLTSAEEDYTYGGTLYVASQLSRSNTVGVPVGKSRELTVTMPVDHAVAQTLLGNGIPPRTATLTVARVHRDTTGSRQKWKGPIAGVQIDGPWALLRVPNAVDVALDVRLPIYKTDPLCQHQLYDANCRASSGAFTLFTGIVSVNGVTVVVADAFPDDGWANGGDIKLVLPDENRRTVLEQVGTTLTIDVPFGGTVPAGTGAFVRAGCAHDIETCRDKFANVPNYGGHPSPPRLNLFSPLTRGIFSVDE